METDWTDIPWNRPYLWREANASLNQVISGNEHRLGESCALAAQIRAGLDAIFPLMDQLCQATCPGCTDICCQRAWVWFDYRDLLFLHLADLGIPPGQLLHRRGQTCRYSTLKGCRLARLQRPFVCTWYVCPDQARRLAGEPGGKKQVLEQALLRIKTLRRRMESVFIRATL